MKLSVVMPVYNEANTILAILDLVRKEQHEKEIIIVDDGSTDGTKDLLADLDDPQIKILFNDQNRGKGYSIRRGFAEATGDVVIVQDADLEYYPDEYKLLVDKIEQGKADVVYGSRFLAAHRAFYFYHYVGNKLLNLLANIFLNTNLTDLMTCYKAFSISALRSLTLEANGFGIEAEITAEVFKRKFRVYEVPISYNGREYDEGKKIQWVDFFRCLYWLFRAWGRSYDVGVDTLFKMRLMANNNRWCYQKITPWLGKRILELGSGVGTISSHLTKVRREITLTDINPRCVSYLKDRFGANPWVTVLETDVADIEKLLPEEQFDTILCINVLEHIEDDEGLLQSARNLTTEGGRLVLLVPSHDHLLGNFDRSLGHYRRYETADLKRKLMETGWTVEIMEFMNALGALGWYFQFKVLKRKRMSGLTIRLFDKMIPLLAAVERTFPPRMGISLFCVAERRGEPASDLGPSASA